jgi:hypothetical protein
MGIIRIDRSLCCAKRMRLSCITVESVCKIGCRLSTNAGIFGLFKDVFVVYQKQDLYQPVRLHFSSCYATQRALHDIVS